MGQRLIGEKTELAIRQAELQKATDTKKAEADAAYRIQEEQQRKSIEITTAEANIAKQEKEILLIQAKEDPKNASKPENIIEKMVMGRIGKFYKENCLVDQEFVKDPELTIAKYTDKVAKELGGDIKIVKFTRFQKGEGLEKRADDFAAEVASMVK